VLDPVVAAAASSSVTAMASQPPPVGAGPRPLDRGAGAPLWAQVHADLMRRLESGEFAELLPGEVSLAGQYGVSRHTVREAMRLLRADGVLLGERGQVARLPAVPATPSTTLYGLEEVATRAGVRPGVVVRALDVRVDEAVARRLDLRPSSPLVYLERLHLAAGEPLALERCWMPAALASPLLEVDLAERSLYGELAKLGIHPWGGAERMSAVVPTAEERKALGIGPRVAAFSIDRQACAGGRFFEIRRMLVRGDRADVYAEFTDRPGYRIDLLPSGGGERDAELPSRMRLLARPPSSQA
jgi:GntR family transcriptional regulator